MGYSCSYRCGKLRIDELYVVPGCYDCHFFVTRSVGCSAWPGAISSVAEGCRRPLCGAVVTSLVLLLQVPTSTSRHLINRSFSFLGIRNCMLSHPAALTLMILLAVSATTALHVQWPPFCPSYSLVESAALPIASNCHKRPDRLGQEQDVHDPNSVQPAYSSCVNSSTCRLQAQLSRRC